MLKRRKSAAHKGSFFLLLALACVLISQHTQATPTPRPANRDTPKTVPPKTIPSKATAKPKKPNPYLDLVKRKAQNKQLLDLMESEQKRYMGFFAKRAIPKVYSLRYEMFQRRGLVLHAADGVLTNAADNRSKPSHQVRVDMRVGDHAFDQTGSDGHDWSITRTLLPTADAIFTDTAVPNLKKQLWQQTDHAYRVSTARYWRKRYVRSIKPKQLDKAGDFTKEKPTRYEAPIEPMLRLDKKKWKGILRRVSGSQRENPRVIESKVHIDGEDNFLLGVGNDGSRVSLRHYGLLWSISIAYLGKNNEYVTGSRNGFVRTEAELPTELQLLATYNEILDGLKRLVASEEGDPDEGPAIVDPMLSGAMFFDILVARLSTGRFLRTNDQRFFEKKLGKPIIPAFLSIIDDPTQSYWGKTPLNSHYLYDDEWVPARPLTMIQDGVLKDFYMSRKPYKNRKASNGHGRAAFGQQPISRPGTTFVKSKRVFPLPALRKMLIEQAKQQGQRYAYILKRFSGYSQVSGTLYSANPDEVLQIDAQTGQEKLLKGLTLRMDAMQLMRGIIATGNDDSVFNGADGEDSGNINIAVVSPSLLLQRISLHRKKIPEKKAFELPFPFAKQPASPAPRKR